jgi:hypothetical protein
MESVSDDIECSPPRAAASRVSAAGIGSRHDAGANGMRSMR